MTQTLAEALARLLAAGPCDVCFEDHYCTCDCHEEQEAAQRQGREALNAFTRSGAWKHRILEDAPGSPEHAGSIPAAVAEGGYDG